MMKRAGRMRYRMISIMMVVFWGGAAFFRGPSTNFFLGFALLLEVVVAVGDRGGGCVGGFAQFLDVLGGAFVEKPFE